MSPPECGSAQFDGDGRCVALTGGYVMDRRMGNTDGLGGIFGLCAALGLPTPLPAWLLRLSRERRLEAHVASCGAAAQATPKPSRLSPCG
mgnify:CR=1 FL=1